MKSRAACLLLAATLTGCIRYDFDHEFFLGPGKHDFAFWSARVPKSLAFLRDHTAKPQ